MMPAAMERAGRLTRHCLEREIGTSDGPAVYHTSPSSSSILLVCGHWTPSQIGFSCETIDPIGPTANSQL
jgi:hypothetical protein